MFFNKNKRKAKKTLLELYEEAYKIQEENKKQTALDNKLFDSKYAHCELVFVYRNKHGILKLFEELNHLKSNKFKYSFKEVNKHDLIDVKLYEYDEFTYRARHEYDPTNKHDPNAIKIYCKDCFIGYVPKHFQPTFREYEDCLMFVRVYGGKYKIFEDLFSTSTEDYEVHFSEGENAFKALLLIEKRRHYTAK